MVKVGSRDPFLFPERERKGGWVSFFLRRTWTDLKVKEGVDKRRVKGGHRSHRMHIVVGGGRLVWFFPVSSDLIAFIRVFLGFPLFFFSFRFDPSFFSLSSSRTRTSFLVLCPEKQFFFFLMGSSPWK